MPSRDVNAATRLAEASWRRDKDSSYASHVTSMLRRDLLKLVGGVIINAIIGVRLFFNL